jgi:Flp pilus assembly pilin Flp
MFTAWIKKFANNESGSTAIEYSLIATLLGVGIVTSLYLVKGGVEGLYTAIYTAFNF